MSFQKYLESRKINSHVLIDMHDYPERLSQVINDLAQSNEERNKKLQAFSLDVKKIEQLLDSLKYPYTNKMLVLLAGKNIQKISAMQKHFQNWARTVKAPWQPEIEVNRTLYNYKSKLMGPSEFNVKQMQELTKELAQKTLENMQKIKTIVEASLQRMNNWNGSTIVIKPNLPFQNVKDFNWFEPIEHAMIYLGTNKDDPSFSYYNDNGKIEVDDVLEAGDDDFFKNPEIQHDYFNLVRELQTPYSTSSKTKILTLYTARPIKDRGIYQKASRDSASGTAFIPSGLFLTTSPYSAYGLAHDLGTNEVRDVWKLKIDSKYLIQTLDAVNEKQYQVIGNKEIPVKWIELYEEGNEK